MNYNYRSSSGYRRHSRYDFGWSSVPGRAAGIDLSNSREYAWRDRRALVGPLSARGANTLGECERRIVRWLCRLDQHALAGGRCSMAHHTRQNQIRFVTYIDGWLLVPAESDPSDRNNAYLDGL